MLAKRAMVVQQAQEEEVSGNEAPLKHGEVVNARISLGAHDAVEVAVVMKRNGKMMGVIDVEAGKCTRCLLLRHDRRQRRMHTNKTAQETIRLFSVRTPRQVSSHPLNNQLKQLPKFHRLCKLQNKRKIVDANGSGDQRKNRGIQHASGTALLNQDHGVKVCGVECSGNVCCRFHHPCEVIMRGDLAHRQQ